jgi:hypothetical protein
VRDGASLEAFGRHIGYSGDGVEVLKYVSDNDGYIWYFVRFQKSKATGWVRGDFVSVFEG